MTREIYVVMGIAAAATGVLVAVWRKARCHHPHPHYVRGGEQAAQYVCYECGKRWPAAVRDPAWAPTGVVRKFTGYDEALATRAAQRAAIEDEQRRFLAAHRVHAAGAHGQTAAPRRGKHRRPSNVVPLNSRKPA
jgi:hypothetical protein